MRILVDINHPARVHFFKNFIWEMETRGHQVVITASKKDLSFSLLERYGFKYISLGSYGNRIIQKVIKVPMLDYSLYRLAKEFKPDILMGTFRAAHISRIFRKPSIIFDDDEYGYMFYSPFASAIIGFCGYSKVGAKIININSYKELAYLSPNYFKPNKNSLNDVGITDKEEYVLLRFVGWSAHHDIGKKGFSFKHKLHLVKELEDHARVFISSEKPLSKDFEKYRLPISPHKMHDILNFAKLFVSDSQTMTTESAILGTPAVRCNSFVGENDMNNFIELERRYKLIYNYDNPDKAINKAKELIQIPGLKSEWEEKRAKLISEKIDATTFMIWFIENYPHSFTEMKNHPEIQYRFASIPGDV